VTVEADDNPNRCIEVADRGVAFQPALNLTLGPLTPGRPAKVANGLFDEPSLREPASAVAVPLVEQQTGPVSHPCLGRVPQQSAPSPELGDIVAGDAGTELPGADIPQKPSRKVDG
jgi:hypothetical protein